MNIRILSPSFFLELFINIKQLIMNKKRVLSEDERQNETYCKIVATILGIPYLESPEGFTETNFRAPSKKEVYLKDIIRDNSVNEFRLYIHPPSGRCFLIAARNEIRRYMILKLESLIWNCPMEMLSQYMPLKGGSIILESTLTICKALQEKYSVFGQYSEDDALIPAIFSRFVHALIAVNQRYEMIYESLPLLSPAQVLSTYDSKFEQKVKMDGKTYTVFDATAVR
jgi:hypothetical protein